MQAGKLLATFRLTLRGTGECGFAILQKGPVQGTLLATERDSFPLGGRYQIERHDVR